MSYVVGFNASARADIKDLYCYILADAGEQIADAINLWNIAAASKHFPNAESDVKTVLEG